MTQLIVALDLDSALEARGLANTLIREAGVEWFKVGPRTLLSSGASDLCERIADYANLFLDLKLYDTVDTVAATARRAFGLGARFLTVYTTARMLVAAMAAKTAERQKVIAVNNLTDSDLNVNLSNAAMGYADGRICSVEAARWLNSGYSATVNPMRPGALLICPGIRPAGTPADNHFRPATPAEAKAAGADYVVVGRPIICAADPIAAARAIMEELK